MSSRIQLTTEILNATNNLINLSDMSAGVIFDIQNSLVLLSSDRSDYSGESARASIVIASEIARLSMNFAYSMDFSGLLNVLDMYRTSSVSGNVDTFPDSSRRLTDAPNLYLGDPSTSLILRLGELMTRAMNPGEAPIFYYSESSSNRYSFCSPEMYVQESAVSVQRSFLEEYQNIPSTNITIKSLSNSTKFSLPLKFSVVTTQKSSMNESLLTSAALVSIINGNPEYNVISISFGHLIKVNYDSMSHTTMSSIDCLSAPMAVNFTCPNGITFTQYCDGTPGRIDAICKTIYKAKCHVFAGSVKTCDVISSSDESTTCRCALDSLNNVSYASAAIDRESVVYVEVAVGINETVAYSSQFFMAEEVQASSLAFSIIGIYLLVVIAFLLVCYMRRLFKLPVKVKNIGIVLPDIVPITDNYIDPESYIQDNYIKQIFQGVFSMKPYGARLLSVIIHKIGILKLFNRKDTAINFVWVLRHFTNMYLMIFFVLFSNGIILPPDRSNECSFFATESTCEQAELTIFMFHKRYCDWTPGNIVNNCGPADIEYDPLLIVAVATISSISLAVVSALLEPIFSNLALPVAKNSASSLQTSSAVGFYNVVAPLSPTDNSLSVDINRRDTDVIMMYEEVFNPFHPEYTEAHLKEMFSWTLDDDNSKNILTLPDDTSMLCKTFLSKINSHQEQFPDPLGHSAFLGDRWGICGDSIPNYVSRTQAAHSGLLKICSTMYRPLSESVIEQAMISVLTRASEIRHLSSTLDIQSRGLIAIREFLLDFIDHSTVAGKYLNSYLRKFIKQKRSSIFEN